MLFRKLEKRNEDTSDLKAPNKWLINLIGGNDTYSGENVTTDTAMNIAAVYACIRILSNHVAMLPLQLYQESRGKKKRIHDHPIAKLIETRPNPYMTPFQFKQTMEAHRQLYGNAYAEIEWSKTGYPKALWILNPLVTKIVMEKDQHGNLKRYLVQTTLVNGQVVNLPYTSVLHIKGLSTNGIVGKSPIDVARETIGIQIAGQKFTGKFYANGTMSSGVLKVPQPLNPEAKQVIRQEWEKFNNGIDNAHRVAILDAGLDYQSLGIKQCDAQYIETQKFSIAEIARIFNVPPHMLADLERATFSNIEQQSLEFVRDTLSPLLISWEQELQYQLFTEDEILNKKYYFKFNLNSLLRGDSTNRAAYYEKMINLGIYSINEVRELEDKDKIKNGDKHYMSLNYIDKKSKLKMRNNKKQNQMKWRISLQMKKKKIQVKTRNKREVETMEKRIKEIRYIPTTDIHIRENPTNSESMIIQGYVVKFNERSHLLYDEWYERVAKGAFAKSLEENTIKALWNHNSDIVLGSTKSRTLELVEDEIGLRFELELPNSSQARDIYESIKRGDVDGVSFGFYIRDNGDKWEYLKDEDVYERTLLDIDLIEISPTPFPAYPTSEVGKRSLQEHNLKTREERVLEELKKAQVNAMIELLKI